MRAGTVQTVLYVCEVYDMVGVTFTNVGVLFIFGRWVSGLYLYDIQHDVRYENLRGCPL